MTHYPFSQSLAIIPQQRNFFFTKGHYYAYWYNFARQTWYCLEDDSVSEVTEKVVRTAYNGESSACTLEYIRSTFQSSWREQDLKLMAAEARTDSSEPAGFSPGKFAGKLVEKFSSLVGIGKNKMKSEDDAVLRARVEMSENQTKTGAENILHHNLGFNELHEGTDALKKKIIENCFGESCWNGEPFGIPPCPDMTE